jgi:hypothetical protein
MTRTAIRRIVKRALHSLRKSLTDETGSYWPQKGDNGIPERNVSTYVAYEFLKAGWFVYVECSIRNQPKKRLDLLSLKKGIMVAGESKQLHDSSKAKELARDAKRLKNFKLLEDYGPPIIHRRYGLLLATAWNSKISTWWRGENHRRPPENSSGEGWNSLGRFLDKHRAMRGSFSLDDEKGGEHTALYAIFTLPK